MLLVRKWLKRSEPGRGSLVYYICGIKHIVWRSPFHLLKEVVENDSKPFTFLVYTNPRQLSNKSECTIREAGIQYIFNLFFRLLLLLGFWGREFELDKWTC